MSKNETLSQLLKSIAVEDVAPEHDCRTSIPLNGVREYTDSDPVSLVRDNDTNGRWCIRATVDDGYNEVTIDLLDLLEQIAMLSRYHGMLNSED